MNSKWLKVMASLLLLIVLAAPAQVLAFDAVIAEIPFTVEYEPGTVVIEALDGAPAPTPAEFEGAASGTFQVTFSTPGNYYYSICQKEGTNPNVVYSDTVYTVRVTVWTEDQQLLAAVSAYVDEEAEENKVASIAFVNTHGTGGLSLKKTVEGAAGETDREWEFTVTLADKNDKTYGDVWFDEGVAKIKLKHGQTVTINGIPAGMAYEVAEIDADKDGYTTTFTGHQGVIGKNTVIEVSCVNTREKVPTDPTDPTDTTKPTDPSDTTKPSDPTDTTKPSDPADTTKPTDPADTAKPTDPPEPTDPANTAKPTESATPSQTPGSSGSTSTATATPSPSSGTTVTNPPKTGDESNLALWIGVAAFSLVAIVFILVSGRKRRSSDEDS